MRRDERAYRTRPGPSDGSLFWGVCVVIAIFYLVKLAYAERATKSVVPAPPLPQLSQPSATSTVRDPNPFKDDPTWHTGPRPTIEAQPPQASVETRTVDKCVVNGAVTDSGPNDCRGGVASSLPIEQGPDAATIAKAQVEAKQEAARVARQVAAIQQRAAAEQANQVVFSAQAQQQANFRQGECVQLDQLIKSLDLQARQPVPDEAVEFFAAMPNIAHPLQLLRDVGLGYLTLGQASPTLSGGEAQRIKLVSELVKVRDDITRRGQKPPHTLYVLDEPTVGLHMADVEKLTRVLHRLGDGGKNVVVIERDFDVIADADWVIDLGPECGDAGGRIVGEGAPYRLVQQHAATFIEQAEAVAGADLPQFVKTEFDGFLACGIRAHCFLRPGCGDCGHDKLVAFSCKRRGFCPS